MIPSTSDMMIFIPASRSTGSCVNIASSRVFRISPADTMSCGKLSNMPLIISVKMSIPAFNTVGKSDVIAALNS